MSLALAFTLVCLQGGDLRDRVASAVVAIDVERTEDPEGAGGPGHAAVHEDYYTRPRGPVSGVIYEPDGFILTSYFNVSGTLRENGLTVTLPDGRRLPAELRGYDEAADIALLKIEAAGLPTLPKADPDGLAQGTFVALVGRAPAPGIPTLNLGILSALNRLRGRAVQTDAEMNYGNAGGALVTLDGTLVGVACHVRPKTAWGQSGGVGFACPIPEIDAVLDRLKSGEKIAAPKRPFLGIMAAPDEGGLRIVVVLPGSPAEQAGLAVGDLILSLDGVEATDPESFQALLMEKKPGGEVRLRVRRATEELEIPVTLSEEPER